MSKQKKKRLLRIELDYLGRRLEKAICNRDVGATTRIIDTGYPANRDTGEGLPLCTAATMGSVRIAKLLIATGADPNRKSNCIRNTPLHTAHNDRMAKCLIAAGSDVNARASHNTVPLHIAAANGRLRVVRTLIENGANLDIAEKGMFGDTALINASFHGFPRIVQVLVNAGANVNYRNKSDWNALMQAAKFKSPAYIQIVKILIDAGAELELKSNQETTALAIACRYGASESARLLLQAGGDANARTNKNETPLTYAVQAKRIDVVQMLLDAGADPRIRISKKHPDPSRAGKTARDIAMEQRNRKIQNLLT